MFKNIFPAILLTIVLGSASAQFPALQTQKSLPEQDEALTKFIQDFHAGLNTLVNAKPDAFEKLKGKKIQEATTFLDEQWESNVLLPEAIKAYVTKTSAGNTYSTEFYDGSDKEEAQMYFDNIVWLVNSVVLDCCPLLLADEEKNEPGKYLFHKYLWLANVSDKNSSFNGLTIQVRIMESIDMNAQNEIVSVFKVLLFVG